MTVPTTPAEKLVAIVVGGHFTPDALGPEYDQILAAVRANPQEHLQAFEHLYLGPEAETARFADLHLPTLLRILAPVAPDAVAHLATALASRFSSVAHEQEAEFAAASEATEANDVARRRRRLNARLAELRPLIPGHS
jgi:hypothetical protein